MQLGGEAQFAWLSWALKLDAGARTYACGYTYIYLDVQIGSIHLMLFGVGATSVYSGELKSNQVMALVHSHRQHLHYFCCPHRACQAYAMSFTESKPKVVVLRRLP